MSQTQPSLDGVPVRLFVIASCASLLSAQPALACANAMKEGEFLNDQQKVLAVGSLLAIMAFVGLYLRSQAKLRAEAAKERFKDLDGDS